MLARHPRKIARVVLEPWPCKRSMVEWLSSSTSSLPPPSSISSIRPFSNTAGSLSRANSHRFKDVFSPLRSTRVNSASRRSSPAPFFSPSFLAAASASAVQPPPLETNLPPSTSPLVSPTAPIPSELPPTLLSTGQPNPAIRWRPKPSMTNLRSDLKVYKSLAKARLSAFTVLTAMAGYVMCPVDPSAAHAAMDALAQSIAGIPLTGQSAAAIGSGLAATTTAVATTAGNSLALSVLLPVTVGTSLCAASAAALNELIEAPYDAQMARTRTRPVPMRIVSPLHAATFGVTTAVVGVSTLAFVSPLAAAVGLGTIVLYCPIYTISKRYTIYNTWLGAVVGALPPFIGWAACTASLNPLTNPGAWALFALLFFWQFPHFNSLAHTLRSSYASSGYRMLPVLDPARNARVSLRYGLALIPLAFTYSALGLTNSLFPWLALVPSGAMAWTAYRFWRVRSDRRAKVLFWVSLVHLPAFLGLAMLTKTGLTWPWSSSSAAGDVEGSSGHEKAELDILSEGE